MLYGKTLEVWNNNFLSTKQEKSYKGIQIGRKEVKLSLFIDNVIIYIENTMYSTKKFLELSDFSKIVRYKIIYKNQLYFNKSTMNRH